ncbi:unnamed protein product [Brassica napus]|uniref:(rape) hypothetical protein n=1 Tax=Brassica napus TaxID=3708 RepID=A0A816SHG4_BRANA|nr:unnamed protein product [Brassica napus]
MIGKADIEGSKSNVAVSAWLPQASYPCGNFSDTSSFKFRRSKGSIGHAFTMCHPSQTPHLTMSSARIDHERVLGLKEGLLPASNSRSNRTRVMLNRVFFPADSAKPVPLAVVSLDSRQGHSGWLFDAGKAPERAVPSPSPADRGGRSRHVSNSSSPPTVGGGCSPWRPDAVMSTTGRGGFSVLRFSRAPGMHRTPRDVRCSSSRWTLPPAEPFPGWAGYERFARQYRCGPPPEFPLAAPLRHSSPSFGSRQACSPRTLLGRSRSVGCAPVRDPANQLPCALRVYSPVDSHTCQTPWSVFQGGSNGEPTGRRPEHADARHAVRRVLQTTVKAAASPRA